MELSPTLYCGENMLSGTFSSGLGLSKRSPSGAKLASTFPSRSACSFALLTEDLESPPLFLRLCIEIREKRLFDRKEIASNRFPLSFSKIVSGFQKSFLPGAALIYFDFLLFSAQIND
jgi:hypothetical protein